MKDNSPSQTEEKEKEVDKAFEFWDDFGGAAFRRIVKKLYLAKKPVPSAHVVKATSPETAAAFKTAYYKAGFINIEFGPHRSESYFLTDRGKQFVELLKQGSKI